MTAVGISTPAPVPPAVAVQIQQDSAERTLRWLKLVGVILCLLLLTSFSSYWWGRISEANRQRAKVADLRSTVIEKQVPVVQKVYEDRIVYKDRIEVIEVPKIVEKKVYQNTCFDDEGVDAFNKLMKP